MEVCRMVGPAPEWLDLGPAFPHPDPAQNGILVREVLGDWSHLHETNRPPKYLYDAPYELQPVGVFDKGPDRPSVRQVHPGRSLAELPKGSGRVAVLFNGSSLAQHDLHEIRQAGIPIIGMNRTYEGYPGYDGPQPDYLCVVDYEWLEVPEVVAHPRLVNGSTDPRPIGYRATRHHRMAPFSVDLVRDGFDCPIPCTTGYLALQLAAFLGFTKIYCLGLDMGGPHFDGTPSSPSMSEAKRRMKRTLTAMLAAGLDVYLCGSPDSACVGIEHRTFQDLVGAS